MIKVDIHSLQKRTERAKTALQKSFSDTGARTACKFMHRLGLNNKSYGRIANHAPCVRRILEIKGGKNVLVDHGKIKNAYSKALPLMKN